MIGLDLRQGEGQTSSFAACVRYITSDTDDSTDKVLYFGSVNLATKTPKLWAVEMTATASQSRSKKPVMHTLLSWKEGEMPTRKQIEQAVKIALKELGLEDHECVWAVHQNTDNIHLHLCINRVNSVTGNAVIVNNGFTDKAMEKVARRIEFVQGWQIDENPWTEALADGTYRELPKFKKKEDKRIPQQVVNLEVRTGEKSAIRIGQEEIKEIIENAKSWQDLHEKLAEKGCRYHQKGSGAVVWIGDTAVKASSISKKCGLNKLQKELGIFEEAAENVTIKKEQEHISKPIKEIKEAAKTDPEKLSDWEQYRAERDKFLEDRKAEKKEALIQFRQEKSKKFKEQNAQHRQERDELKAQGWKGRGKKFNEERSSLAAVHAVEKAELIEELNTKKKLLMAQFSVSFVSYKEWLKRKKSNEKVEDWRYRKGRVNQLLDEFNRYDNPNPPKDIRAFFGRADANTGYVSYVEQTSQAVAFIDRGKSIKVQVIDDKSVLASLQLAQQKWGGVKVSGSKEYIEKCIELAVKHNIRISNPELQDHIEKAKAEYYAAQKQAAVNTPPVDGVVAAIKEKQPETAEIQTQAEITTRMNTSDIDSVNSIIDPPKKWNYGAIEVVVDDLSGKVESVKIDKETFMMLPEQPEDEGIKHENCTKYHLWGLVKDLPNLLKEVKINTQLMNQEKEQTRFVPDRDAPAAKPIKKDIENER